MVATIVFFHGKVKEWIEELCLPQEIEKVIFERCIPGRYIELVASRTKDKEKRAALKALAAKLLLSPEEKERYWSGFDDNMRIMIEFVIEECAQLFQRSSACVEGRNGHLRLFHHGLHLLSDRKLEALTIVHNYYKVHFDGTTAAERFFGAKPNRLFDWLLDHLEVPARPAKPRNIEYRRAFTG